jgi:hypothetical protein
MSVADAGKFFTIASQNPAIMARLSAGPSDLPSIFGRAVAEGKLLGITFTSDDAEEYLNEQAAAQSATPPTPAIKPIAQDKRAKRPTGPTTIFGLPKNTEPLIPPTDSFGHFLDWLGHQKPPGYGGRRH